MEMPDFLPQFAGHLNARTVFSEPCQQDGATIITAAQVRGGGRMNRQAEHDNGGMGMSGRPVGAYVIRGGEVSWKPAIDLNRVIFRGQLIALTALLVFGLLRRRR